MLRGVTKCCLNAMRLIAGVGYEIQVSCFQLAVDEADSWRWGRKNYIRSEVACERSPESGLIRDKVSHRGARAEQTFGDSPNLPPFGFRLHKTWRCRGQAMRSNYNSTVPCIFFNFLVCRER